MASALAHLELVLLCVLTLVLALLETPVPRQWALAGTALVAVQTGALHAMSLEALEPGPRSPALVHSVAEAIAVLAVPAFTAALLTVVFFHLARGYAQARRRLEEATSRG